MHYLNFILKHFHQCKIVKEIVVRKNEQASLLCFNPPQVILADNQGFFSVGNGEFHRNLVCLDRFVANTHTSSRRSLWGS
jgi:hypothetical protein